MSNKKLDLEGLPGDTGLGHSRWDTHGSVTDKNAHPHYGCKQNIAIVHRDDNHKGLREELVDKGHIFESDTDSEVIAHLLEKYYAEQKNRKKAVIETCKRLKGEYAFVAVFDDGSICGSRYNEPLIIGSVVQCGPEVGVAATKSFMAQLSLIYPVIDRLCNGSIGFDANKTKLGELLHEILATEIEIQTVAERIRDAKDIYVIGRSIHYPIALEGALKLKELAYVHTEGMTAGELKHGTLALIERNSYVIIVNPNDMTFDDNISTMHEIKARGATIIGISDRSNEVYDIFIKIPSVKSIIYPMLEVLPLQILAYYMALGKNADPDYHAI
jgi:glucosamine 6-phosphate synthetase-like amidotransferase/phosphosugar isomerase protein